MNKYFYILIWLIYFISLYILKEWYISKNFTDFLNLYLPLDKIYYISYIFVGIFIITTIIDTLFLKLQNKETKKSISKHILPLLRKIIKIIIRIFWIITVISNLGYNVWALLAWAWIWWIALALASQKTVANIFWAINIIINRPFEIGDHIKIWNFEWIVEDIWIIYLKVKNIEKWHQIMIPNETITTSVVENFSAKK